jgi:hypothetical protein
VDEVFYLHKSLRALLRIYALNLLGREPHNIKNTDKKRYSWLQSRRKNLSDGVPAVFISSWHVSVSHLTKTGQEDIAGQADARTTLEGKKRQWLKP